ncbi:hypothetical protein COW81_00425 [Candidatus Campbellbacteria bacterium CG22_combo_CG10-13_8_21_14_all_36_13]|uniref:Uncharacterized protein n=1 Tax=Candidatus Campbellbacteria bacterium CG22_combo_CG10-13_8_21_14_all_36_13 TaxID=1974529 RepID=A0A2H0E0C6_9BACT|nr:MAG: hypothetical protein COW81_00425 [Candidatus Campbellbacteria bacterium CG22_combo_CG10-13_8_21_14_all_36_13]
MEEHNNKNLFIAVGVLLLIVLVYFLFFSGGLKSNSNISMNKIDIAGAKTDADKLPGAFPTNTPVELSNITESYSTEYKDDGFIQNSLSYTSQKSLGDIYSEYEKFMEENGYEISNSILDVDFASLEGTIDGDDLSIVVEDSNGTRTVSASYLDR